MARDLRALRLWQSSRQRGAQYGFTVELHRCCARVSRAAALVQQHIDGVARASSAGTKSGSIAHSLVLLTILAPVSRSAELGDQLGLDDEVNSIIADGGATRKAAAGGTSVGDYRVHFVVEP